MIIDQHLTWQCHIEYILKKIRSKLFGLHCLKPLSNSLLATLYCRYFLPIFDYCDTVWSPPTTRATERGAGQLGHFALDATLLMGPKRLIYSNRTVKYSIKAVTTYILPWAPQALSAALPTTVFSKSLERIHAHFASSLPCIDGFVMLTLAEHHRFHTAVQVFKSINKLTGYSCVSS